jgi:hypothetical protein
MTSRTSTAISFNNPSLYTLTDSKKKPPPLWSAYENLQIKKILINNYGKRSISSLKESWVHLTKQLNKFTGFNKTHTQVYEKVRRICSYILNEPFNKLLTEKERFSSAQTTDSLSTSSEDFITSQAPITLQSASLPLSPLTRKKRKASPLEEPPGKKVKNVWTYYENLCLKQLLITKYGEQSVLSIKNIIGSWPNLTKEFNEKADSNKTRMQTYDK